MYDYIFETVVKGSNTMFLDMDAEDYYLKYDSLSEKNAQDLVNQYFKTKGKDGIPHVTGVDTDPSTHRIMVVIEVQQRRNTKLEPYVIPDVLNMRR